MKSVKSQKRSRSLKTYQEYLKRFEKGAISLKQSASIRIVLIYPNRYSIGMASLGFQSVYRMLNDHPDVRCERCFIEPEYSDEPLIAFESGDRISEFDVVGISLSFELDIINLIKGLLSSGIPMHRSERLEKDPFILLGGVVAGLNPSPLLPYVDGLLAGEGEGILFQIADTFVHQKNERASRNMLSEALAKHPGVFIPDLSTSVQRYQSPEDSNTPQYTPVVTSKSHFQNMFVIELSRGCKFGCYFCAGQHVYAPYRFFPEEHILSAIENKNPSALKVGLEGAGISSHPSLNSIIRKCINRNLKLSLSSIRPDRIDSDFVQILKEIGTQSFTMAPECGSESLRNRIGKGIQDEKMISAVQMLSQTDIRVLKLYYLIGLPGETDDDVMAIVRSVQELSKVWMSTNKSREIRLSINGFIPKPFTEFQWAGISETSELNRKRKIIQNGLKSVKNVNITQKSSRQEILQAYLSLGDENAGLTLLKMIKDGLTFQQAVQRYQIDLKKSLHSPSTIEMIFPWDWISYSTPKQVLWNRYARAMSKKIDTP